MTQQHVPQLVQDLAPLLDRYGLWAVLGSIFFEDFGVPLPGETMLIAGAFFAALGHFGIGRRTWTERRAPAAGRVRLAHVGSLFSRAFVLDALL